MAKRRVRSDKTVGNFEKDSGLPPGAVRHPSGKKMRSDKTIGAIRKEADKR